MAEYIERERLLKEIQRQKDASRTSYPKQHFVVGDVLTCIYLAEAADIAPVVHGRWLNPEYLDGHTVGECSECHKIRVIDNFCPACGAKMDQA